MKYMFIDFSSKDNLLDTEKRNYHFREVGGGRLQPFKLRGKSGFFQRRLTILIPIHYHMYKLPRTKIV